MMTCQKEVSTDTGGPVPPGSTPTNGPVTASVVGRIIDEYGEPVKGANVKTGTSFTTTDINGEFKFADAQFAEKAAFLKVSKSGYFDGSRTFTARQGNKHFIEIQLIPKILAGSINGSTGGSLNLGNGSSINLPGNGVVIESTGASYTGSVKVSMAWIDPTSKDLFRQMPGDLRGIDANNSTVNMESYGMLGVELTGTSGEKLQIAPGKKASLKFPLPSAIQGTAPATIALWSFNDTTGLWKQEGTATKSGNGYLADVSHFSWWNCDVPVTVAANFSATIVDQNGQPLKGAHIIVRRTSGMGFGAHGYTDSSGYVGGNIPANEALQLVIEAPYPCSGVLHTQNIGPFNSNNNNSLGNITVNISGTTMVTLIGTASNCSGSPVTDGFVEVMSGLATYRANVVNGNFSLNFLKCTAGSVSYAVIDNATNQQSNVVTINATAGINNVGTVAACGVSTDEYIHYTYDGVPYSITKTDSAVGGLEYPNSNYLVISGGTPSMYNTWITMRCQIATFAAGQHPLYTMAFSFPSGLMLQYTLGGMDATGTVVISPVKMNITSFGPVGSYIEGNVSASLTDQYQVVHPFQCTFRVKREK